MEAPQNIVLLPAPLFLGHLISFIQLAKNLVSHHNFIVTLIIPHETSSIKTKKTLLQQIPHTIIPVFLPPLPTDNLPETQHPEILSATHIIRLLPSLRHALLSLETPAIALVVDLFAPYAIDIAKELGIPSYIFFTTAAYQLSMFLDFTKFDLISAPAEMQGSPPTIMLPGSVLLDQEDFSDLMKDNNIKVRKWFGDLTKKYFSADGILVNSFSELESEAFKNLELHHSVSVYRVGPLICESEPDHECVKWLNNQPSKSVVFVSFGSGGVLSMEQVKELALGLEMSEHRFVWVVRSPQKDAAASYLNTTQNKKEDNTFDFLPEGFLQRTNGRGLVVPSWAPQVRVLSHTSTGGFLTHCGWSSILESVVYGVPMIAWPLCFEQKMNGVYLKDGVKVALRVRENENGVVERENVAEVVRELMEGEEGKKIEKRVMELKVAAGNALSKEGSSTKAIAQLVQNWINGN